MEERLKKFVTLIDAGTYTAAAKQLHTSQPALTTAMQKLSREIKLDLLVQGSRTLLMTPAGHIAYAHGQQLLLAEKNFYAQLQNLEGKKQALNLGSIDSIANLVVQAELLSVLERDCEVSLSVQNSSELMSVLQKGALDVVLVVGQQDHMPLTDERALGKEQFALVCSKEQSESYREACKQGLLTSFLAYNQTSTTYELLKSQLNANGIRFEPQLYSTNPSVLLQLALQGRGIAALPLNLVTNYLGQELIEIELKRPLSRPIVALWQTGHTLPKSLEEFLDDAQVQLI